jgi:hypothetical protein
MKRLLHMAAVSVLTKKDGELREYYDRKVSDGKNKMLVINVLRSKLVARMFAVIKHDKPYMPQAKTGKTMFSRGTDFHGPKLFSPKCLHKP